MRNPRRLIEAVEATESGVHIVRLMRIFDAASVNEFEKVLAYLLARGQYKIVVDLANVEFVASAGWGALTAEFRRVRDNSGDIRLAGMNPDVLDVFFLLELDSFMSAYDTLETALSSFEIELPSSLLVAETAPATPGEAAAQIKARAVHDLIVHEVEDRAGKKAKKSQAARANKRTESVRRKAEPEDREPYPVTESFDPVEPAPPALLPEQAASSREASKPAAAAREDFGATDLVVEEWQATADDSKNYHGPSSFAAEKAITAPAKSEKSPPSSKPKKSKTGRIRVQQTVADEAQLLPAVSAASAMPEIVAVESDSAPSLLLNAHASHANDVAGEAPHHDQAETAPTREEAQPFEDFAMQDIHDPWLTDEIDSLPEEFEVEEGEWQNLSRAGEIETAAKYFSAPLAEMIEPAQVAEVLLPAAAEKNYAVMSTAVLSEARATVAYASTKSTPAEIAVSKRRPSSPRKKRAHKQFAVTAEERSRDNLLASLPAMPISRTVAGAKPQPLHQNGEIIKVESEGDRIELVRQIVKEHPQYGPTMITKFFETRVNPPVKASRSTIYRWLRLAGLNTRTQRREFVDDREPGSFEEEPGE